jgi:hypothetical protein
MATPTPITTPIPAGAEDISGGKGFFVGGQNAQGNVVPVKVAPSTTTDTNVLTSAPKTTLDVQSLIADNNKSYQSFLDSQTKLQNQYTDALKPDDNITTLTKQLNALKNQSLNTNLSAQAGILQAGQKVIPMEYIVGQQANIAQQANLKLQTLAAQQAPIIDQLNLAKDSKTQLLKGLETLMQFGRDNYTSATEHSNFVLGLQKYQKELDQITKSEQEAAKELALKYNVTQPYYEVSGTVYRTSDGKAYSTPEELAADGGSFAQVQKIVPKADYSGLPAAAAEYEYAKSQGYKGSFEDYQNADANRKLRASGGSSGGATPKSTTDASVRKFIEDNKKANPDANWYDLWGELADDIQQNLHVSPSNYDNLFWELLHPEGAAGYDKYVKNKRN